MSRPLIGFYGDDFTGSTDALEALTLAGVHTVLFVERPTREDLERFEGVEAVGFAGMSRTMSPDEMSDRLTPDFERLKLLRPVVTHYKTCSTFDSSPETGSIGKAIDLGRDVFGGAFVPLLVGAPRLGRYCAFGNLFARSGLDSPVFRLDRHPTMSRHPVTPMHEADLRRHLGRQTTKRIALFDLLNYEADPVEVGKRLKALLAEGPDVVLFDALYDRHLEAVGGLIWESARDEASPFVAGSSGVEYALAAHWQASGRIAPPSHDFSLRPAPQLVVVSGSCSPVAAAQIDHAVASGFAELRLETAQMAAAAASVRRRAAREAVEALRDGRSVIIHTCSGPDDPRLAATKAAFGEEAPRITAVLGRELGRILRIVLKETGLRRAIVAGGDTSGHAAKELGVEALEMVAQLTPGTPLCRVHARAADLDGLELAFKGGQTGNVDFYDAVLRGDEERIRATA